MSGHAECRRVEQRLREANRRLQAQGPALERDKLIAALNDRVADLEAKGANLIEKLRRVHDDERYKTVWTISQLHIGPYSGLTYTAELDAFETTLTSIKETV